MQMSSRSGCFTSLPDTQAAQKIGSRLKLGPLYSSKKKKKDRRKRFTKYSVITISFFAKISSGLLKQGPLLEYLKYNRFTQVLFCEQHFRTRLLGKVRSFILSLTF